MVAKGNSAQVTRARRAPTDTESVPIKLKKKVVAVRSDAAVGAAPPPSSSSAAPPTASSTAAVSHATDASPVTDTERTSTQQNWPHLQPADSAASPSPSPSHGAQQLHQLKELTLRETPDDPTKEEPHRDESKPQASPSTSTLVAIAPAKPGTMLPKDLIMAKYRVKPDAPKFLLMLYEILQHESPEVIRWTEDGLALQILDQANVTEKVLPKYFNHTNFHSFQRQLNYFGFRKWTKSKTDICTFSHPYFRRNQPELMHLIKRKKATRRAGAAEQGEAAYPSDAYATGGGGGAAPTSSSSSSSSSLATSTAQKKLLPLSPSGKRRLAPDSSDDGGGHRGFANATGGKSLAAAGAALLPGLSASHSSMGQHFLPTAVSLTNAISPASGGAKKKAKTNASGNKSFAPAEQGATGAPPAPLQSDPAAIAALGLPPGSLPKGGLPNLDLVRNRLSYRLPGPEGAAGSVPSFTGAFPIAPNVAPQLQAGSGDSAPQNGSSSATSAPASSSSATLSESSSSMFTNSFSDPVDILLRIKKSRAMSHDNTLVQSPQQSQGQVEGFASLQNFLLSQSMYTNRLESQLKLAMEENEALRHLVDAKQREVEALLNERKMIQNENSVLTEDKNKLFEINRDLLSKLFPQ